jgi:Nif-specific regulatory protein
MSHRVLDSNWLTWDEVPWLTRSDQTGAIIQLCERLLQAATESSSVGELLRTGLAEIATELPVQWCAVFQRTPEWKVVAERGRPATKSIPFHFFVEVLDREAGGFLPLEEPAGWSLMAVPLAHESLPGGVLMLAGRNLTADVLPTAVVLGRVLSMAAQISGASESSARRIEQLHTILQIASSFASTRESGPLLELIAKESTRLLNCDRASIFIWDRDHHEVIACPALGVEGGTLRLPDTVGIVGEVLRTGQPARVDDCYTDPRFSKNVDQTSGYVTRNMLCWPLRDADGDLIGTFEVMNKNGGLFTAEDEESLTQLAVQAAIAIRNAREREELLRSRKQLKEQVTQGVRIIGSSPAIAALRATVQRLAGTDLPVLILGESGTGKEVVAQSLHYQGPRAEHPFVAVNCAALAETLLESELFGHEKGAFTDARETRQGKFELAERGTLFLDEIGDMSLGGQAKLLRVLEQKVITRVGGSQAIPINVRVIAATNSDLVEAVRAKKFREDLYYRLSVVTQHLPPLRERPEDILELADYFLGRFCIQANRKPLKLSAEARRRLQAHAWPGNVRELRNLMERVAFLAAGERVEAEDLAFILSPDRNASLEPSADMGLTEATKQFQQEFIRRAIKRVKGNMSETARLLGLHRSNLYRKMRHLDMHEAEMEAE